MTNTYRLEQKLKDENNLIWALDKYADYGVLQGYEDISNEAKPLAEELLKKYELKGIYLKKRYINDPKQTEALTELIAGEDAPNEIEVEENDLKFIIKLKERLDVGLFLDHRPSREIIAKEVAGKDFLNLFAYTGSFSIYAAKNGAKTTTTVDLSNTYSEWTKRNFEVNGMDANYNGSNPESENYIWKEDVFEFLKIAKETGEKYDVIVFDPPSFSRNKTSHFSVQEDHERIIKEIEDYILRPGGFLFFSTNLKNFVLSRYIRPGADKLTNKTIPKEFQPYKAHQSFVFYN